MNICLYGASSPEIDPVYLDAAYAFGRLLAQHGHTLVYGGGAQGVMGAAARGAYEAGGKITGIAPTFLQVDGILFDHCTEFLLTDTMDFMEARTVTEPSAPEVETAGKGDLDEIFACAQRFVADCGLLDKPEKEPFRKVLDSFRILRADGKIVSMARIAPATQDDLRLVLVYTRDEYRGRGYARKVVNSAKNEILAAGKRVTLNVDRKNPVSYHLYRSLGFERMFSQGEFRRVDNRTES